MTVLVWTIGTSVVEMPLGKEVETAVMVTVWVCTRGGCGWEHSPMSGCLTRHFAAHSNQFVSHHALPPFKPLSVWSDFHRNSLFTLTKFVYDFFGNNRITVLLPLPTTD